MSSVTREAVETLANEKGVTVLAMLTELQGAAARLGDEETLEVLINIKSDEIEALGL